MFTAEDYRRQLAALLPKGIIWPRDGESDLGRFLAALAEELARLDARAEDLVLETDPRQTFELLADWERVCGLPGVCEEVGEAVAQRRASVLARLTSIGGQTPAFFKALAATPGYDIEIVEYAAFTTETGVDRPLNDDAWTHTWEVQAPSTGRGYLDCMGSCADPLSWWGLDKLECVIRAAAPAHTVVLFVYSAYLVTEAGELLMTEDGDHILVPI